MQFMLAVLVVLGSLVCAPTVFADTQIQVYSSVEVFADDACETLLPTNSMVELIWSADSIADPPFNPYDDVTLSQMLTGTEGFVLSSSGTPLDAGTFTVSPGYLYVRVWRSETPFVFTPYADSPMTLVVGPGPSMALDVTENQPLCLRTPALSMPPLSGTTHYAGPAEGWIWITAAGGDSRFAPSPSDRPRIP